MVSEADSQENAELALRQRDFCRQSSRKYQVPTNAAEKIARRNSVLGGISLANPNCPVVLVNLSPTNPFFSAQPASSGRRVAAAFEQAARVHEDTQEWASGIDAFPQSSRITFPASIR